VNSTPVGGISLQGPGSLGTLRFLLASVVVLLHTDLLAFASAQVAVLSFYFLSGFIMGFAFRRYQGRSLAALRFFLNRFLRLAPSFFLVVACTHLILVLSTDPFALRFSHIYLRDLLPYKAEGSVNPEALFALDSRLAEAYLGFASEYVPQSWSIGNELIFYLTVPILALLTLKAKWALWGSSLALFISQTILNFDDFDYFVYSNALATYFFFISGYLLPSIASLLTKENNSYLRRNEKKPKLVVLSVLLIVVIAPKFSSQSLNPLITLALTFALMAAIVFYTIANREDASQRDQFFGNLAYPLYISHIFVIGLTNALWEIPNIFIFSILALACSWVASILIYFLVEKPIEVLRTLIRRPSPGFDLEAEQMRGGRELPHQKLV